MKVSNDVAREIIVNDGCRRGSAAPINATGIVRLALDLEEARSMLENLLHSEGHKLSDANLKALQEYCTRAAG